jgi:hypothetical protein
VDALYMHLDEAQNQTTATITEQHGAHYVRAHFCYSTVVQAMKKVALHHESRSVHTNTMFRMQIHNISVHIHLRILHIYAMKKVSPHICIHHQKFFNISVFHVQYIYIYIHTYMHIYIYIYIYAHICIRVGPDDGKGHKTKTTSQA